MEKLRQCSEVLMTPDTSCDASEDSFSGSEHEADLSSLGPPLGHGELLNELEREGGHQGVEGLFLWHAHHWSHHRRRAC